MKEKAAAEARAREQAQAEKFSFEDLQEKIKSEVERIAREKLQVEKVPAAAGSGEPDRYSEEYIAQLKASLKPTDVNTRIELSDIYAELKRFEEATMPLKEILAVHPEYADINFKLAKLYVNIGRFDQAVAHFKLAIAINQNFIEAHRSLAALYMNMGETEMAAHEIEAMNVLQGKGKTASAAQESPRAAQEPPAGKQVEDTELSKKLRNLRKMYDDGLITEEDFKERKKKLLENF
jgi:Tfp pilus assembly protein PilF